MAAMNETIKKLMVGFASLVDKGQNADVTSEIDKFLSSVLSVIDKGKITIDNVKKINKYLEEKGIKYEFSLMESVRDPNITMPALIDRLIAETEDKVKLHQSVILSLIDYKKSL